MNIKQGLIGELKKQLKIEEGARDIYQKFVKKIENKMIGDNINRIIKDEVEHIAIVKKLINIVESYKKPIAVKSVLEKREIKENKKLKGILADCNAVILLFSETGTYIQKISFIVNEFINQKKMIYVSYNKIPKYVKKVLEEHKVDLRKILFINCTGVKSIGDINVNPGALTEISIAIREVMSRLKKSVVVIDSISAFTTYYNNDTVVQFVSSLNDEARKKNTCILWVAINNPAEKILNNRLSQVCDKTVKL